MKARVLAAMSGGVDSSVAAALLKQAGFDVVGITLQLLPRAEESGKKVCCGLSGIEDARRTAAALDIPHYVLDFREIFARDVIADFLDEYKTGRTPNPCIRCNRFVKFGALFHKADELEARYIATGHYARVERNGRPRLLRGTDGARDQSYFLYGLEESRVERALFPLGALAKTEVRSAAAELGLRVATKPASQDICFITDDDYRRFMTEVAPEALQPGSLYDTKGTYLGRHKGVAFYTVGQRRGLEVARGRRMYVTAIDPVENRVILGEEQEGYGRELLADQVNLIGIDRWQGEMKVAAKIRQGMAAVPAAARFADGARFRVRFDEPQWAISPGQAVVLYDGERVLGGGIITKKLS